MEIYVKLFDKKFNVKPSNKAVRNALKMQYEFAKMNNTSDKSDVDVYASQIAVIDAAESFMKDTLKLTKKQTEALDDMDFQETMSAVGYISNRMMGMSDEQIKEDTEKVREDPKK